MVTVRIPVRRVAMARTTSRARSVAVTSMRPTVGRIRSARTPAAGYGVAVRAGGNLLDAVPRTRWARSTHPPQGEPTHEDQDPRHHRTDAAAPLRRHLVQRRRQEDQLERHLEPPAGRRRPE